LAKVELRTLRTITESPCPVMPGTLASHRTAPVHQHSTCSERRHLPASRVREKMPVRRHPKAGHGRLRIHASFRPQPRKQSEFGWDFSRSFQVDPRSVPHRDRRNALSISAISLSERSRKVRTRAGGGVAVITVYAGRVAWCVGGAWTTSRPFHFRLWSQAELQRAVPTGSDWPLLAL